MSNDFYYWSSKVHNANKNYPTFNYMPWMYFSETSTYFSTDIKATHVGLWPLERKKSKLIMDNTKTQKPNDYLFVEEY